MCVCIYIYIYTHEHIHILAVGAGHTVAGLATGQTVAWGARTVSFQNFMFVFAA